jgi:hypothetical protein
VRVLRWIVLPLIVAGCAVATFALFLRIYTYIVDVCPADYGLDIPLCPAPWAPVVLSAVFCVGSVVGAALCVVAAYAVAPVARSRAVHITALLLALLAIYMFFIHRRWELFSAVIAAFGASFLMSRHHLRSTPNT